MIGQFLVHVLLGVSIGSVASYAHSLSQKTSYSQQWGRNLFYAAAAIIFCIAVLLMINVVTHDFSYFYVWNYSSRELATPFLVASFYSGQEGSFLLWTLWVVCIGLMIMPYVRRHNYEREVMFTLGLILCFLVLMLVAKNPFSFLWEHFAQSGVVENEVRTKIAEGQLNGKGLNPLLHNIWITIHPPILFTGFASMSVPFVFAIAALMKRDYQRWIDIAFPWTLFATAILGFGIMLGGFWAYETLGWGGFWAWDPVENSSLIPWLVSVALVHTMLVQRKTKGLIKTNIILATLCFVLVLYSTFLTRSGVLGDTSVHSFVDPGFFAYVLLIVFMVGFSIFGIGMVLWRMKDISQSTQTFQYTSREFGLSIGSAIVLASAIIVTLGTSYPIIAEIIGKPKVAVDTMFYNISHIWIMIAFLIVNAISLVLSWKKTSYSTILQRLRIALGISISVTALSYFLGVRSPQYLALLFFSFLSLSVNIQLAIKILTKNPSLLGAYISHAGIAFLMIGIIATSGYSQLQHVRLVNNKPVEVFGSQLTYVGRQQIEKEFTDREKFTYYIKVENQGKEQWVRPIVYWSDFNKRQSPFMEPGIRWSLSHDLYISPKSIETEGSAPKQNVMKGATTRFPFDTLSSLTLVKFDMSEAQKSDMEGYLKLATIVSIKTPSMNLPIEQKIYTYFNGKEFVPITTSIPNTNYQIALTKVVRNQADPEKSMAEFAFIDKNNDSTVPKEVFVAEVSIKPFINFVWFGVLTMVAGFGISILRHRKSLKASRPLTLEPADPASREESPIPNILEPLNDMPLA